jgi:hypothetical protein
VGSDPEHKRKRLKSCVHIDARKFIVRIRIKMDSQTRKKYLQLQGPRPAPLTVNKSSTKIKKQPLPNRTRSSPVIIYLQSPKVIHVRPEEFMGIVQQLTGNQAPSRVAADSSSHQCSFSSTTTTTSRVMVDDETMGMGISRAGQHQHTFNNYSGVDLEYGADPDFGIPSIISDFAEYPSFHMNIDP